MFGQFHVPATLPPPPKKQASVPICRRQNERGFLINLRGPQNEENLLKNLKKLSVSLTAPFSMVWFYQNSVLYRDIIYNQLL